MQTIINEKSNCLLTIAKHKKYVVTFNIGLLKENLAKVTDIKLSKT